ncbi:MAG: hypothetical protein ACI85U_004161 [Candidatus Promineifilaceae bacterium]|jgi:hypothetical protein
MARKITWLLFGLLLFATIVSCGQSDQAEVVANAETTVTVAMPIIEPTEPTASPVSAGIWIDPSAALNEISPLVYGTNYGPWQAVSVENQPAFEASGLKFLRFPGGRWGDSNNLRDYHIKQLMAHVDQLDGDVTISARLLDGTPEQAADLMRLVNDKLGHDVRYWSIGNEPSLYADLQKADEWDTVYFNQQWRLFADAMLAVDPEITLLGPNTHQFLADESANPKDENGLDWMREFLKANGDMVDVVTFHRYPFPQSKTNPLPTVDQLRENSREWDQIIPKIRQVIKEETGRDIPIGVMEINSNWSNASGGDATPDSHFGGIWWADVLARMIQQDVDMVTHFALQSKSAGWAMLGRIDVRPTYYVYQLYQKLGETRLASGSDDRYVTVLAARRAADDALTVVLINLADDPVTHSFQIGDETAVSVDEVWLFDPEHNAENLGSVELNGSIELPGQSMTLLVIKE